MLLNLDECIETLKAGECVSERSLKYLCQYVAELLMEESNVQPVTSPVTVCQRRVEAYSRYGLYSLILLNFCFSFALFLDRLWETYMVNILIC